MIPAPLDQAPAAATVGTLDIVTVPDFRPKSAALFEARTLFFLGSWLERAGAYARSAFRLHLACIGEPPGSVRQLAAQCGATISLHEPLQLNDGLTTNKLRGLETVTDGSRLLLLDSDLLVLNDLGGLANAAPADTFAAAPSCAHRVSDEYWERIYNTLNLPGPAERILSIRAERGLNEASPMYPYYNSGVLLFPPGYDVRNLWERDIASIRSIFLAQAQAKITPPLLAVTASDQAGLATALHRLRLGGMPFCRLPEAFHYRPSHFAGGTLPFDEVRLFHAIHFLRGLKARSEIEPLMEGYIQRWTGEIRSGWRRRGRLRFLWRGWSDANKAAGFLRGVWRRQVQPALFANS